MVKNITEITSIPKRRERHYKFKIFTILDISCI